ncbi:hypothetical protein AAC387_Pa01g2880 [Persea americana]
MTFGQGIKLLALGQNEFSGKLPSTLANLSFPEHLDLHNNRITGNLPKSLFKISTLKTLNLRKHSLEGPIPNVLSTSFQILDLSNNNLIGSILSIFEILTGMIKPLKTFFSIPGLFSSTTRAFPTRIIINLHDVYGNLPDATVNFHDVIMNWKGSMQPLALTNLNIYSFLDMSSNRLSGEIPTALGNLRDLKTLSSLTTLWKDPDKFWELRESRELGLISQPPLW